MIVLDSPAVDGSYTLAMGLHVLRTSVCKDEQCGRNRELGLAPRGVQGGWRASRLWAHRRMSLPSAALSALMGLWLLYGESLGA